MTAENERFVVLVEAVQLRRTRAVRAHQRVVDRVRRRILHEAGTIEKIARQA